MLHFFHLMRNVSDLMAVFGYKLTFFYIHSAKNQRKESAPRGG